jgi:hypothetical protein
MTQMHALPDSRDTLARPNVHLVSGDLFGGLTRAPHDLDEAESVAASKEAAEFVSTIGPWKIPPGHGTYREKRPGLGVTIHGYDVDCSVEPHAMTVRYSVSAWRTAGETRFGDSLLALPNTRNQPTP